MYAMLINAWFIGPSLLQFSNKIKPITIFRHSSFERYLPVLSRLVWCHAGRNVSIWIGRYVSLNFNFFFFCCALWLFFRSSQRGKCSFLFHKFKRCCFVVCFHNRAWLLTSLFLHFCITWLSHFPVAYFHILFPKLFSLRSLFNSSWFLYFL